MHFAPRTPHCPEVSAIVAVTGFGFIDQEAPGLRIRSLQGPPGGSGRVEGTKGGSVTLEDMEKVLRKG